MASLEKNPQQQSIESKNQDDDYKYKDYLRKLAYYIRDPRRPWGRPCRFIIICKDRK
jgi:hypothetical protein